VTTGKRWIEEREENDVALHLSLPVIRVTKGKRWIEEREEYDVALHLGLPHPDVSACVRVAAQALAPGKKQPFHRFNQ
jgi:hypothetical protein